MPGSLDDGSRPRLEDVVASPRLPTLPTVALRIIELVERPDVAIDDLAAVVLNDPALAAKFLQTANSSFYARARPVTRVHDALVVLGLRTVKPLALGFSLVAQMRDHEAGSFDYTEFWTRSLFAAAIARAVAAHARTADPGDAFLGGLLHCLGMVALSRAVGGAYDELVLESGGRLDRQVELEIERFGFDHASAGFALAEKWRLPPSTATAMRCYFRPEEAAPELLPLVRCVAVGAAGSRVFVGDDAATALRDFRDLCETGFGLSPAEADELLAAAHAEAVAMGGLLDLPSLDAASVNEILSNANAALERLAIQAIRDSEELERQNVDLSIEAATDALTGAASRRYLDAFLNIQVELARRTAACISVLFVDLDHFKKLNDCYGHQAGDRMLAAVSASMRDVARAADLVGRYGGEEFVIACPGTNLLGAVNLARRVQEVLTATFVDDGHGGRLVVTVSIGVASLEAGAGCTAAELLAAADRGLFAAKAAGRNAIRIGQLSVSASRAA